MKRTFLPKLLPAALSFALLTAPAAQALTLEQAAELLQRTYIDEVPQFVLEQPTIDDMIEALGDPYTEYFTAEEYRDFVDSMSDATLVGIGIVSVSTEEGLLLEQVLEGSPAFKGGLKAGDLITMVDNRSVLGEDSDTVVGWIQGEEGTEVTITYLRDGEEKTVTLTRAVVVVPATTTELIGDHIGYIRCTTFGSETVGHFQEGIEAYRDKATVWIVDLRSNAGGSTDAAVHAAGLFTGAGEITYLRDGAGAYSAYYHEDTSLTIYPVIVLVNEYSASASEIFASAIQDYGAGIVIGTRTYGKGVAQVVLDQSYLPNYFPDGDAIKITSYRFFSPDGNTTDQIGVIPTLLVAPEYVDGVAHLLAGLDPRSDNANTLRVDLDWRWFIDLDIAVSEEYQKSFLALLNAIPDNKAVWKGNGQGGWQRTSPGKIADEYEFLKVGYQSPIFPDQDDSDYYTPLSVLKTYGLVHGKDDGKFHPQDTLTRAELCQFLAEALNCTVPANDSPYSDVAPDAWYTPAVIAMTNMGLVNGVGDGTFRPEATVDHQQFITIMGRMAQWLNMYLYNTASNMPEGVDNIVGLMAYDDWAKPYAWLLSYSQKGLLGNTISLLWDSANEISPNGATTRDEAVYTLYRILNFTDILPS